MAHVGFNHQMLEATVKQPIPFGSFGGYRRFCIYWWGDLWRWISGGWWRDLVAFWHRARYGWAPRDCWNLDHYLACVLGGTLCHLAAHTDSAPVGYPQQEPTDAKTAFEQWEADLTRWGHALAAYARDDYYEIHGNDYEAWRKDEEARLAAVQAALRELEPWFAFLWD